MNLEEAKANIGKEVVLDESTKPYKCPLNGTHNFGSNVYGVIECVKNSYVKVRLKVGNRINIMPKHLKTLISQFHESAVLYCVFHG